MKIQFDHFGFRRRECGMATLIFIALLAIMVILIAANVKTILQLGAEEKLIEQKQIQRLDSQTNAETVVETRERNPNERN